MNYDYTAEQKAVFEQFSKLAQERIAPHADRLDKGSEAERAKLLRANLADLGGFGYLGMLAPAPSGGGRPLADVAVLAEELGRACPATFLSSLASMHCGLGIALFGDAALRQRLLPGLFAGELIGAFAQAEPGCGSDVEAITTRAERDNDAWRLYGTKAMVTNGPLCDVALVLARTSEGELGLFITERGAGGFTPGRSLEKLGCRGAPLSELVLDGAPAATLGAPAQGREQRRRLQLLGRALYSAASVGLARACFTLATDYSNERQAFGKQLFKFQEVAFKLSDMKMLIDTGMLLERKAAWLIDSNATDAEIVADCAKVFCSEATTKISSLALQIHGGYGCLAEYPIERLYRDARLGEISGGTNELLRMAIAADCLSPFE